MILQCDQCSTKFRLDDSKLKPGGVKVRCSKCRHVFVAGAEPRQEESEFDAILSGLGAPVAQTKSDAVAPDADQEMADFGFDQEPAAAPSVGAPAAAAAPEPPAPGQQGTPAEAADFAAFDFPESFESAAPPAPAAEPAQQFSDFELAPSAAPQEPAATPVGQGLDYGEFSFDEEPAPLREDPATSATAGGLDFGEFTFADEPAASQQVQEKEPAAALDFGEFDFAAEPAAEKPQEPAQPAGLDFGEFSFEETPHSEEPVLPAREEKGAVAAGEPFDFDAFSFSEEPAQQHQAPEGAKSEFGFGDFSFNEEPPVLTEQAVEPASEPHAEFAAVPPLPAPPFADASQAKEQPASPVAGDDFSFDDFPFAQDGAKPAGGGVIFPEQAAAPEAAAGRPEPAPTLGVAAGETAVPPPAAPLDFGFDLPSEPTQVPDHYEGDDEELPPLSISSRRKGRSLVTVSIVAISVLVIVALSGAGLYLLQSGPEAFDKLGLGFVAHWLGMEGAEEGRITIKNPQASFVQNKEAGELFVVTGEAVNSFRKARGSIHVKVTLFDKKGAVLAQKTAYCGNRISSQQLATLPIAKLESIMNNQFGDSLSNLGVKPGGNIGFVVALANVPKEAADFGVEVIGSTVAGK